MRNRSNRIRVCLGILALVIGAAAGTGLAAQKELPLEFTGGHEIGKDDFGRPVVLIAAALGVKPDDFRKAFSGVTPAKGGPPSGAEARKNKEALMKVLAPLGVTNERLDEVSDYYRFRSQNGELWKSSPAAGHAIVEDGKVTRIVITDAGSGYSTPPKVTIQGMPDVTLKVVVHLDKEFKRNGSVETVGVVEPPKQSR